MRSSATVEDLPDTSFAGQQDTYLNVHGAGAVQDAVRRCWASLWTTRAMIYRARRGIAPDEVSIAVVVQQLVPAEAAGVLFTADPQTGDPGRMVVNASWGLGESVVNGQVTPDTLVLDPSSGRVLEQHLGDKTVMTVRAPEGTREQPVSDELRAAPVLDAAQAGELAGIGTRIARLYGGPVDIEWALHDGHFAVVQARPITVVSRELEVWNDSRDGDFLSSNGNLGEAIPDVMTRAPGHWCRSSWPARWPRRRCPASPARLRADRWAVLHVHQPYHLARCRLRRQHATHVHRHRTGLRVVPPGVEVPVVRLPRIRTALALTRAGIGVTRRARAAAATLDADLAQVPARCAQLHRKIADTASDQELAALWTHQVEPLLLDVCQGMEVLRLSGRALATVPKQLAVLGR